MKATKTAKRANIKVVTKKSVIKTKKPLNPAEILKRKKLGMKIFAIMSIFIWTFSSINFFYYLLKLLIETINVVVSIASVDASLIELIKILEAFNEKEQQIKSVLIGFTPIYITAICLAVIWNSRFLEKSLHKLYSSSSQRKKRNNSLKTQRIKEEKEERLAYEFVKQYR